VETLYPGSPLGVLAAIGHLPETVETPLLLGHNPNLEVLVQQMGGEPEHFPTAAVAEVNVAAVPWALAAQDLPRFLAGCRLAHIWRPKALFP
jgi:phosphohistidine phosphatase SixA